MDVDQAMRWVSARNPQYGVYTSQDHAAAKALYKEVGQLQLKLRAADVMAKRVDETVERKALNPRSPIADARLDYGDPGQYEFTKGDD